MPGDQAGDTIALHLDVIPDGGVDVDDTTVATVEVVLDGAVRRPTARPDPDRGRARWTALLTDAAAGLHSVRWTVAGTGAGVTVYDLPVAPVGPRAGARSYATTGQLAEHMAAAPPVGAHRLLERATERVDEMVRCAVYDVDDAGMPTDPKVAAALAEATCATVQWWAETGDRTGTGSSTALAGAQIGSVRLPSAAPAADGLPPGYAPEARRVLAAAGLTAAGPILSGARR